MVRKWSYLTMTAGGTVEKPLSAIAKCYSFKVFRMTTRFKKYQRYGTSFVRKQDSSRKRQTSWLTLLSILAQWSLQYIKYKQYLRYYQNSNLYRYQFVIPNIFVIQKKINLFSSQLSFITSTLTSQLLCTFQPNTENLYYRSNSLNTFSTNESSIPSLKEVNVSGVVHDRHIFTELEAVNLSQYQNPQVFFTLMYTNSLQYTLQLYKILILLSLYRSIKNILWSYKRPYTNQTHCTHYNA